MITRPTLNGVIAAGRRRSDPLFSYVALLLHMEGTNGSTSIVDSSSYADNKTANAGQEISTGTSKFGGASFKIARQNPAAVIYSGSRLARASGQAYTIEGWYKRVSVVNATESPRFFQWLEAGNSVIALAQYLTGNQLQFRLFTDTPTQYSYTPDAGGWIHWAITINASNTLNLWIGGTSVYSTTFTSAISTPNINIGGTPTQQSATASEAYLDEVRVTVGAARYTATFTPPTEAFPSS